MDRTAKYQWINDIKLNHYSAFCKRKLLLSQAWIVTPDIGQCPTKIELCPTKAASQRIQFSGLKLKKIVSYRCLKTNKHSVSVSLSSSDFSWNILIDNLLTQFIYIQNRKICSSKKILYQYYRVFLIFFKKGLSDV